MRVPIICLAHMCLVLDRNLLPILFFESILIIIASGRWSSRYPHGYKPGWITAFDWILFFIVPRLLFCLRLSSPLVRSTKCSPGTNKGGKQTQTMHHLKGASAWTLFAAPSIELCLTYNVCHRQTIVAKWGKNESCAIPGPEVSQSKFNIPHPRILPTFPPRIPLLLSVFSSVLLRLLFRPTSPGPSPSPWHRVKPLGTASSTVSVGGGWDQSLRF